jgi:hypothetical protein
MNPETLAAAVAAEKQAGEIILTRNSLQKVKVLNYQSDLSRICKAKFRVLSR